MTLKSISQHARERMTEKHSRAMKKALLDSVEMVHAGELVEVFPKPRAGDVTEFSYGWTEPHLMTAAGAIPQSKWTRIPHEGKVK